MPDYRRLYVPGGAYFFTVNLRDRRQSLLTENYALLKACIEGVRKRHPFETAAYVILPDHLHVIWQMPNGDAGYSTRWRLIKSGFSRSLPKSMESKAGRRKGERGIWQRRFWEHRIRDDDDMNNHIDYIHHNPIKHGYVDHPSEWKYSSWKDHNP